MMTVTATEPGHGFDGAKLRAWREAEGLTRPEVCVAAGLSHTWLVALELGTKTPSLALLARLAAVFGRDPGELLTAGDGGTP
jgi:transcriptional regulator with XRE-family HTH domain